MSIKLVVIAFYPN